MGGFWTCRGRQLALAPVVHGVAGDGHRRCHGDSWAAHGELVGDRVMRAAAAGTLLSSCGPLDDSCAHDGSHPGVSVVYNPCVQWMRICTKGDEIVVGDC